MPDYSDFQIILDVPTARPALGFHEYARALQQIVEKSTPRFAIGIFGSWGSGKTTLMRQLQSTLNPTTNISVQFSAWRYEKEEHLIVPLLDSVRSAVVHWADLQQGVKVKKAALRVASAVGKATHALLHGFSLKIGLPNAIEASFEANKALERAEQYAAEELAARVPRSFYLASFDSLSDAFNDLRQAGGRRIVVFIDDLDRCLPEGALEVLESMKLFFDIEGFVFVVGLDRAVVEKCIDAKYAKEFLHAANPQDQMQIRGEDYIKKIFQVPFNLAPVSMRQIPEYVESICSDPSLDSEQRADLRQRVQPHLASISTAGVNPRELKRFINSYVVQMKVKPHLDPDAVLALETIRFRSEWKEVQLALLQYRDLFINTVKNPDPRLALNALDPSFDTRIPDSFLAYVAPGSPGERLLLVPSIDEYLYGGEATKSSLGPVFVDLIRDTTNLRISIIRAKSAADLRPVVETVQSLESRMRDSRWGTSASRLADLTASLRQHLMEAPTADRNDDWRVGTMRDIDLLIQQLAALYQSTN